MALGAILLLLAWTTVRGRFQGWKGVGPAEAIQLINHEDAIVVDIREDAEFKGGYILNSVHVPLTQLRANVQRLEKYRDRPVVVSCRTGSRSAAACATLSKQGFGSVYNLRGGIVAWQNANLPLSKK